MSQNQNRLEHPKSNTYLVTKGNVTVKYSPSVVGAVRLTNSANDIVNLADGQLGVVMQEPSIQALKEHFLVTGYTVADCPVIQLVQGTPNSNEVLAVGQYPIGHRAYVRSAKIDGRNAVKFVGQQFYASTSDAWQLGDVAANPGAFTPVDDVQYTFKLGFRGRTLSRKYGQADNLTMTVSLTKEAATYTNNIDRFLKRLALLTNFNSNVASRRLNPGTPGQYPVMAWGINIAGGTGTALSTIVAANIGNTVNYATHQGRTVSFTITADLVTTVAELIATSAVNIAGASTIQVIDMSTAGSAAAGAGTLSIDSIVFVSIDSSDAAIRDQVWDKKIYLTPSLSAGFLDSVKLERGSVANAGNGYGRQLFLEYERNAGQQIFSQQVLPAENTGILTPPNYFDVAAGIYNVFHIFHFDEQESDIRNVTNAHRTTIVIPCAFATSAGEATTVTGANAALTTWLNSIPQFSKNTPATSPSLFI